MQSQAEFRYYEHSHICLPIMSPIRDTWESCVESSTGANDSIRARSPLAFTIILAIGCPSKTDSEYSRLLY